MQPPTSTVTTRPQPCRAQRPLRVTTPPCRRCSAPLTTFRAGRHRSARSATHGPMSDRTHSPASKGDRQAHQVTVLLPDHPPVLTPAAARALLRIVQAAAHRQRATGTQKSGEVDGSEPAARERRAA